MPYRYKSVCMCLTQVQTNCSNVRRVAYTGELCNPTDCSDVFLIAVVKPISRRVLTWVNNQFDPPHQKFYVAFFRNHTVGSSKTKIEIAGSSTSSTPSFEAGNKIKATVHCGCHLLRRILWTAQPVSPGTATKQQDDRFQGICPQPTRHAMDKAPEPFGVAQLLGLGC